MIISEKIPSRLEVIPGLLSALMERIKHLLTEEDAFHVRLSLEEALVNAIRHGNKLNPDLSVELTIEAKDNYLTIKVKDQGEGFDFSKIPDPTKSTNLHKPSGRGIFLIKNLMDDVDIFDSGRGIKMTKFLKKGLEREEKGG